MHTLYITTINSLMHPYCEYVPHFRDQASVGLCQYVYVHVLNLPCPVGSMYSGWLTGRKQNRVLAKQSSWQFLMQVHCTTRCIIFSKTQHYAVYTCAIESVHNTLSHHNQQLNVPFGTTTLLPTHWKLKPQTTFSIQVSNDESFIFKPHCQ